MEEKKGFFARLKEGLFRSRNGFVKEMDETFLGYDEIDEEFYEDLEGILIMGDLGVETTERLIEHLRQQVDLQGLTKPAECKKVLVDAIRDEMIISRSDFAFEEETSVVMVVGVNGVGKTTTIGKLATRYRRDGLRVLIAGADTFRAAAGDQLQEWAQRAGVEMIGGQEGADPGSVVYDSVQAAKARKADMLLVDTAGRLHNKRNLMQELEKLNRIIEREWPGVRRETLLVLDATTGQNALSQALEFKEIAPVSGIVLTKMDGTAKGGIAIAIATQLGIPVKYIGVGEKVEDLERFNAVEFVNALFGED